MNTFNKKSLYTAIAGLSALGVTGIAEAVHVNPDGLGQVLIYPYYTARQTPSTARFPNAQYNTLLSVVNSTVSAKAVKVRFLESLNSREVLDFNLYLSHNDVWTAGIVPTADGAGVVTYDKSCTTPSLTAGTVYPFVASQFSGSNADGADSSLDRTREGYIEIIEMGDIVSGSATETGVTHVSGVPPCTGLSDAVAATNTVAGSGGLFGDLTIINVNATAETSGDATALEAFTAAPLWAVPSSIHPTLADGTVLTSETYKAGAVVTATWTTGIDAVSAAMMHDTLMNEYILDSGTKSGTDWIVTYPTKRYYVSVGTGTPPKLFQRNFGASGACDDVLVAFWDREEQVKAGPPPSFSPPLPGVPPSSLCYEANVVTFNNTNVFSSKNSRNVDMGTFQNGWARINLVGGATPPIHQLISTTGQTFNGLPVIGFATATFFNGTLPAVPPSTAPTQSAYGGSYRHKYTSN